MSHQILSLFMTHMILLYTGLVFAQVPARDIRIDNSVTDTVFYCKSPVAVAPMISIENVELKQPSEGIKISIADYNKSEDKLFYTGSKFKAVWNEDLGNLELTGLGTDEELQEAVRQVFYENTASSPTELTRSLSISLIDADYLPYTGHFYRYTPFLDMTWKEARDSAANMEYYGLKGYLATITSTIENDFIWSKIDGVGWIGASDEEEEGIWKWVTGPENGNIFWRGNYTGYLIMGSYAHWATGEPNNSGDEDFAHINQNPQKEQKSWNDLKNAGDGPQSAHYRAQGFVVEYGGMPGDPVVQLSASAMISWSLKPEMRLENFDSLVCGVLQQKLKMNFDQEVSASLHAIQPKSQVIDAYSLSPTVVVEEVGNFQFELEVTNRHKCTWYDTIDIKFQHQPTARFQIDEAECEGYSLNLFFVGDLETDALFDWYSNDTVYFSGINADTIEIPLGYGTINRSVALIINENGCTDSLKLPVTVTPVVSFWPETSEGCTPLNVQFNYSATETVATFLWEFEDGNQSNEEKPGHTFQNAGTADRNFDVSLKVISAEGCENLGTIREMVTVHPIPTIDFSFDEKTCYNEIGEVWYNGSAGQRDTFLWDLSDFYKEEIIENPAHGAGPFKFTLPGRPSALIGLQVITGFGCKTDTLLKTFTRKPSFSVPADVITGCPPLSANITLSTTDSVDQVNYYWEFGNGQTAEGMDVSMLYTDKDKNLDVSVVAVSSLTGCADTLLLPGKIVVHPVPEASFVAQPFSVLISNPVIHFENTSNGGTAFKWNFGDYSFGSTDEHPVYQYGKMDLYNVSLLAYNQFGCLDSALSQVVVTFDKVFPPTTFSPNAVKEEDRIFRIYSEGIVEEGYKLLIFNRWGEVIYTSHSQEEGWDGRMKNGANAPTGAYFWVLEYADFLGKTHTQQGSVTLLF